MGRWRASRSTNIVIFMPVGLYAFVSAVRPGEGALVWFGIACVLGVTFGA